MSTTTIPMATKLCILVTYHEELPLIKFLDHLITFLHEVTWYMKFALVLDQNSHQAWQGVDSPQRSSTHDFK